MLNVCLTFYYFILLIIPGRPISTFFPYTTLFRSLIRNSFSWMSREGRLSWRVFLLTISVPPVNCGEILSRSEEHTSELQSHSDLVCRLLLEKKNHDHKGIR